MTVTRFCLDPWKYVEVSASGGIRPCCNFPSISALGPEVNDLGDALYQKEFQNLRESLLSGQLMEPCTRCHIRKTVPLRTLRRRIEKEALKTNTNDLLKQMQIAEIRIDITEKCNLRCDYCEVSSPSYDGVEMHASVFETVLALLRREQGVRVYVNGHGETTYHPSWRTWCEKIIAAGHRPIITTNLAKPFTDEEIALLAQFHTVQVSLDSHDPEMMKTIRKAIDVEKIFATMKLIRKSAEQNGSSHKPTFSMSVGVYDPAVWTLEDFVDRLIAMDISAITFWNLVEKPHQGKVTPLNHLDKNKLRQARDILLKVRARLVKQGVRYDFAGDFDEIIPPNSDSKLLKIVGIAARRLRFWA